MKSYRHLKPLESLEECLQDLKKKKWQFHPFTFQQKFKQVIVVLVKRVLN